MSGKRMAAVVVGVLIGTALIAAGGRNYETLVTSSECTIALEVEICTWVKTDGGQPIEMGATIPLALIESVPTDVEMVWPPQPLATAPLPIEAKELLGFDHLGVNWEAHGHPPQSFLVQHFDFHFYTLDQEAVRSIDCARDDKPGALPRGYALPDIDVPGLGMLEGLCVPQMGMHAMPGEDVVESAPFDASMMLGYYEGRLIFFEPMISRDALLDRANLTLPVPTLDRVPAGVRAPHAFRMEYDRTADAYHLVFSGFDAG